MVRLLVRPLSTDRRVDAVAEGDTSSVGGWVKPENRRRCMHMRVASEWATMVRLRLYRVARRIVVQAAVQ